MVKRERQFYVEYELRNPFAILDVDVAVQYVYSLRLIV